MSLEDIEIPEAATTEEKIFQVVNRYSEFGLVPQCAQGDFDVSNNGSWNCSGVSLLCSSVRVNIARDRTCGRLTAPRSVHLAPSRV